MKSIYPTYDVIVVGGGHAGSEAAASAARLGAKTLLVTMNLAAIGQMSCNPAIGGIGKGQLVREIDALGGIMGLVTDQTGVQFRMLNKSKGPAVWSPRAQSDRMEYAALVKSTLESIPNLSLRMDMVVEVLVDADKRVTGIRTQTDQIFNSRSVILTSGTFLNGTIHIGLNQYGGGRAGERAATGLSACLEGFGFETGRLKTGTPPRLDGRTIDYSKMIEQPGDDPPLPFSFMTDSLRQDQLHCWLAYTGHEVHEELKKGFDRSPMFNGSIQSTGPRYCPSIEDKINRFADKDRHQLFVEPEGRDTYEIYVNGFSTSLPEEVQVAAIQKVVGMEKAHILRPGYAIEYDYFPPHQLKYSLETKLVSGLFHAGQINGTTGYEEAAVQGLVAGINAIKYLGEEDPVIFKRSEAYIGVLIDDLVAKGTEEPYRMFTSRAEHRILLRQDNADLRLTQKGYDLGLADKVRLDRMLDKKEALEISKASMRKEVARPEEVNGYLESLGTTPISEPTKIHKIALRPEVNLSDLLRHTPQLSDKIKEVPGMQDTETLLEVDFKYEGYLEREFETVAKMNQLEDWNVPADLDFNRVGNITMEAREKLDRIRPTNLGQASRISGVSPADISVLMILLKKSSAEEVSA